MKRPYIQPSVVPFIDSQFDVLYRENYPMYVSFVRAYYAWMEQTGGATERLRGFLDYRDVDRAPDPFLLMLKEKYVQGLTLDTMSDTRLLIKHVKDLYRAKGTPRAMELFFRLLYDEAISIYYPKDDILVASDGNWVRPTYLELSISSDNVLLESKNIEGLTSGAIGFVDDVVRRLVNDRLHDVVYVSAISGNFQTGEVIAPSDGSLPVQRCPTIIGSMNRIILDSSGSGSGHAVGDVLDVHSSFGVLGQARVSNTVDRANILNLSLTDGGYGYTTNSVLTLSNTVVLLSNVVYSNNQMRGPVRIRDTLTQPLLSVNFTNANGTIMVGDHVRTWSGGVMTGDSTVLNVSYSNSIAGVMTLSTISGNLVSNAYYTLANAVSANLDPVLGANDVSFSGTIIGYGQSNVGLTLANQTGAFVTGEIVVQHNPLWPTDGGVLGSAVVVRAPIGSVTLSNVVGIFQNGPIVGLSSASRGSVSGVSIAVGLTGLTNSPTTAHGNRVSIPGLSGTLSFVSHGVLGTFGISNTMTYLETVSINSDQLSSLASANLSGPYGLSGNVAADINTPMSNYLSYASVTVGQLVGLFGIVPGTQLDSPPIVLIEESRTDRMQTFDITLSITGATSAFSIGDNITQAATNARGAVRSISANGSVLRVGSLRINPNNAFVQTTNTTTVLVGGASGAQANVVAVYTDQDRPPIGINATISANVVSSNGAVTEVQILDSGFGYAQDEVVWMGNHDSFVQTDPTGVVRLLTHGTGRGFYANKGGFLSDVKKVFDGDYYQNFSYEITSSQPIEKYRQPVRDFVHVAGMKMFGRLRHARTMDSPTVTNSSVRTRINFPVGAGTSVGSSTGAGTVNKIYAKGVSQGASVPAAIGQQKRVAAGSASGSATVHN